MRRASDSHTPLSSACSRGDIEIVQLLLEKGADCKSAGRAFGHSPQLGVLMAVTSRSSSYSLRRERT
jgi:ankyrin repeat protein